MLRQAEAETARRRLAEAIQRVALGDRAALHSVYRLTSAKLFGICLRILQDWSEAEDVLQDAYLAVWSRAGSFDPERSSPVTWLVSIARHRAIDRLRAGKSHLARPIEEAQTVEDPAPSASELVEAGDERRRLLRCLDELEPEHGRYIRSAFAGGLTYQALSERSGVPLGTMKSWIRRGLIRLRACLER